MIRRNQGQMCSESGIKDQKYSSPSPFSYYMSEMIPNYEELISSNIRQLKFSELPKEEGDIGTQIDKTIKRYHNFIIPAISLELNNHSLHEQRIEFQPENLKQLFSLFGEIKFIDISPSSNKAYVLYKYYFSALYAFDTIKGILAQKDSRDQITIKLVNENLKQENPQQNGKTPIRLNLTTKCQSYVPKSYQSKQSLNEVVSTVPHTNISLNVPYFMLQYPLNNNIHFSTFSSREYLYKYVTNYDVQIENDSDFQVTKRIIGKNGLLLKKIIYDSCISYNDYSTKVRLRGKGSGYKEGPENKESEEPLQLCVSSLNYQTYVKCCQMLQLFLERLYSDYYFFMKGKNKDKDQTKLEIMKYEFIVNRFPSMQ